MLAGLDAEQLSFIDQYLSSGQKIVGTTEIETPDARDLLNSAALVQQGEAQTENQDMKSYSESVAKAADVVNKESDAYDLKESMSFTELKA